MARAAFFLLVVAVLAVNGCDGCNQVLLYDFNPQRENGLPATAATSPAGLMLGVGGNASTLYAVSLNAGVWRSISTDVNKPAPWVQLWKSPFGAYSLAVDPSNPAHLAVGQRDGENANAATNQAGVWESVDSGNTWTDYFDPRAVNAACASQAIPSLAYSSTGALVAATSCGVAVRSAKGQPFVYPASAVNAFGNRPITAIAVSRNHVWARDSSYNLMISDSSGQNWTALPAPPGGIVSGGTGDMSSLGALETLAAMICLGKDNGAGNNYTKLLIWDVGQNAWIQQERVADSLNGTGAGGRRFVRAYSFGRGTQFGSDVELFVSNSQEVYRAVSRNQDGTINFTLVAKTGASGAPGPNDPNFGNTLHTDMWDFHWVTGATTRAFVATDGGVYESRLDGKGWLTRSKALLTHHSHTIFIPMGFGTGPGMTYCTQDNDAWEHDQNGPDWTPLGCLGDVNFTAGDAGLSSMGVVARQFGGGCCGGGCGIITGFGQPLPTSGKTAFNIVLNNDTTFFQNPLAFQFIQTRKGENYGKLDAVMLTVLPLTYNDSGSKTVIPGSGFGLVRNRDFERNPDINVGKGAGWELAADSLPAGVLGFWVSAPKGQSAHSNPDYFVYTSLNGAPSQIWEGDGKIPTTWTRIDPFGGGPGALVSGGGRFGPVFVNPYDSDEIYVLATDRVRVGHRTNGVWTFTDDTALSSLVSRGGRYPFVPAFSGGNSIGVDIGNHNGGTGMGTLGSMGWDRDDPTHIVAASPFDGVFVNLGDGKWRDLTRYLPAPLAPPAQVTISGSRVYVLSEGRGLVYLDGVNYAR
jgi:hypothetical protein